MTPVAKRDLVAATRASYRVSERRACEALASRIRWCGMAAWPIRSSRCVGVCVNWRRRVWHMAIVGCTFCFGGKAGR